MKELRDAIDGLIERAKAARVAAMTLACPATVAGDELATLLAELSRDFGGLSVALRQSAREVADAEAQARRTWQPKGRTAARAAAEMERQGAFRVSA